MDAKPILSKEDRQRLEKLEARARAGKPLTRTKRFALSNLARLREQQKLVDRMKGD